MNPYESKITVVSIRPMERGNLKALADIQLGETMIIHGCRIVQQPGQRAYVALPQNESGGKYYPVVTAVDKRFKEAIEVKVLAAWEAGDEATDQQDRLAEALVKGMHNAAKNAERDAGQRRRWK